MASDHGPGANPDPVELVLSRLRERGCLPRPSRSRPGQWSARCPAHDDRRPSLSLGAGDDGRALVNCKRGCDFEAVVAALGLRPADLHTRDDRGRPISSLHYDSLQRAADDQAERIGGERVGLYRYTYADDMLGFAMARYRTAKGKELFPFSRNRHGRWTIKAPQKDRPLYRLREAVKAPRVVAVEGEKCAELVHDKLGLVATTSAFGAKSPDRTDWSPLAGKEVLIVPDCDPSGRDYARKVARLLANLNPAPSVKIVNLPGLEEGEDVEQWLERRHADETRDQTLEAFEALVAASAGPPRHDGRQTQERRAIDWLREVLADGPIPSNEIMERAKAAGFSERVIERAKQPAGVESRKIGGAWYFVLPVEPPTAKAATEIASKTANRNRKDRSKAAKSKTAKAASKTAKPSITLNKEKSSLSPDPDTDSLSPDPDTDFLSPDPDPHGMDTQASESDGLAGNPPSVDAPAPEPTVGQTPSPEPARPPTPVTPLYALVSAHREPYDRSVMTPKGPGRLLQVFADRAGVVLDAAPGRFAFFDPSLITVPLAPPPPRG